MSDKNLVSMGSKSFEDLKKVNEYGAEYWSSREIQPLLGYTQWRRFEDAIKRALTSCKQSGNTPENHFADAGKMVELGSGSSREIPDYHLSRFACYLIAQNGDPRKPEIANAQKYFAIQARRQEISDAIAADIERLELRKQTAEEFKALSGAARDAGVHDRMFGVFHDAGYKGMYGGLGRDAIKKQKGILEKENLMDRMDTTELAANQFRMTQTRDKLARERVKDQQSAIRTHENETPIISLFKCFNDNNKNEVTLCTYQDIAFDTDEILTYKSNNYKVFASQKTLFPALKWDLLRSLIYEQIKKELPTAFEHLSL